MKKESRYLSEKALNELEALAIKFDMEIDVEFIGYENSKFVAICNRKDFDKIERLKKLSKVA